MSNAFFGQEIYISPMEPKDGVSGAEIEKFWFEEYLPNIIELPGYHVSLCKGHHGKRPDGYLYIGNFESSQRLNELFPYDGPQGSDEWNQWIEDNPVQAMLLSLFDDSWLNEFTHYVAL